MKAIAEALAANDTVRTLHLQVWCGVVWCGMVCRRAAWCWSLMIVTSHYFLAMSFWSRQMDCRKIKSYSTIVMLPNRFAAYHTIPCQTMPNHPFRFVLRFFMGVWCGVMWCGVVQFGCFIQLGIVLGCCRD